MGKKEPRVISDMTPELDEKGEAEAEQAEIAAARQEYQRIIAERVEFMQRKGYPYTVGKGKFPLGWDPRLITPNMAAKIT
ncbi:hypothetical protein E2562_009572 [Oryza meyeriana var. granulata]|uniref:Uncharacterized protein n=1 Tax=Oryza meyeriana var. granulata TaxID=110450 RepID=A0A6G1F630_9ORYZ|nr:hypothetical protein E2562_009572 [Oryza meyeriana var. granulata]